MGHVAYSGSDLMYHACSRAEVVILMYGACSKAMLGFQGLEKMSFNSFVLLFWL
jgi:hypothetical protein